MQAMPPTVRKVVAATDRSATADQAARWAAHLASSYGAELLLLRVLPQADSEAPPPEAVAEAQSDLGRFAAELAGGRGRALVRADSDPVRAILGAVEDSQADVIVLGNAGMAGRRQFLLGN